MSLVRARYPFLGRKKHNYKLVVKGSLDWRKWKEKEVMWKNKEKGKSKERMWKEKEEVDRMGWEGKKS